jgi:nitrogen fixation protein FixH
MSTTTTKAGGLRWILIVIGLLAGNVLAMVVLISMSSHGGSRVLDGYYERGVHYDDAIDQDARNRKLAWQVDVAIQDGVAIVTANDAQGRPLEHARVTISGVERAKTAHAITGELLATRAGEYRAHLGGAGWVDLSVTIDRGSDRYVHTLALEAR